MKRIFLCLAFIIVSCHSSTEDVEWSPGWNSNPDSDMKITGPEAMMLPRDWVISGKSGMVSSANPLATRAGVEILKNGGTAIDALLAVQWVLNVVEPQSSGIGGGAFLVYYDSKSKRVYSLDGREEAPASASEKMFLQTNGKPIPFYPDRVSGGLPVGIPGTLALMFYSQKKFGNAKISFAQTFKRAIELAQNGFRVSPRMSLSIKANLSRLKLQKESRKIFLVNGREYRPGEVIFQRELADTFRLIASQGPSIFYQGEIASDIIQSVKNSSVNPTVITKKDLRDYRVVERRPVWAVFKGHKIFTMPQPSSAVSMLQALKIMDGFPEQKLNLKNIGAIHLKLEAEKLAFADRSVWLGDPDFSNIDHNALLNTQYISSQRKLISSTSTLTAPTRHGNPPGIKRIGKPGLADHIEGNNTTHISIIDQWGNIASCTSTIEMGFGSALVVNNRGFLLNNELTDFNEMPGSVNSASGKRMARITALNTSAKQTKGGKRPISSMSPVIVFKDNKPVYILGSPGGSRIPGIVNSVLLRLIIEKLDMQQAINAPRALHRNKKTAELEYLYFQKKQMITRLSQLGHKIQPVSRFNRVYGGVNGIEIGTNGNLWGGSDTRREGSAMGVEEN